MNSTPISENEFSQSTKVSSIPPAQMNTAKKSSKPSSPSHIHFQKKVIKYVVVKLEWDDFVQYHMKQGEKESDDDFHERCLQVWTKLCKTADKHDVIEVDDEEIDQDDNDDCEEEIEELIELWSEQVDKDNEC